ncbi:hypothetical protein HOA92_03520 [archaeon]|nr:hypothetical protein [archaeon]MBT6762081.1 hypothetical protein [archaeon]
MTAKTITIPLKEYKKLKKLEQVEWELVGQFTQSLKEVREGKLIEC